MTRPASKPTQLLRDIPVEIDRAAVLRALGYGRGRGPDGKVARLLDDLIGQGREMLAPMAAYRIEPVAAIDDARVELADGSRFRGQIGRFIGRAECVALFVATIGPELERTSQDRMHAGHLLEGAVLDAVGSDAVEQVADFVSRCVLDAAADMDPAWETTLRYSPGYCGMHLTQQRPLFDALDAAAVGVRLSDVCLMQPIKSVSGLIGIGPAGAIEDIGNPCRFCGKSDCLMRRDA